MKALEFRLWSRSFNKRKRGFEYLQAMQQKMRRIRSIRRGKIFKKEAVGVASPVLEHRKENVVDAPGDDHNVIENDTEHDECDGPPPQPFPLGVDF